MVFDRPMVSQWQLAITNVIARGVGAIGLLALVTLGTPTAQAQSPGLLDCMRRAGNDPYALARCRNPNAQAPNLEEPITPSPGSGNSGGPPPSQPNSASGPNSGPNRGSGSSATSTGVPASRYNSANRSRITIDCMSAYSDQPSALLTECGAWAPRRNTPTPSATPQFPTSPNQGPPAQTIR